MKRISVMGLGRSGIACAKLLKDRGFEVFASDINYKEIELVRSILGNGIEIELGKNSEKILDSNMIVVSPGIPLSHPIILKARKIGLPVVGELEMASRFIPEGITTIAITGTNGKTMTAFMIQKILEKGNKTSIVTGNASPGIPLSGALTYIKDGTLPIIEVSTFQLETIKEFHPNIAVLLNISPDHLDRHSKFDDYVKLKAKIFVNQGANDFGILNFDDELVKEIGGGLSSQKIFFSKRNRSDAYIENNNIVWRDAPVCNIKELAFKGDFFLEDVLAAVAVAKTLDVNTENLRQGLLDWSGVPHRLEFVAEKRGVKFINNSMCTNPVAFSKTLLSFRKPLILIAGGKSKRIDYTEMLDAIIKGAKSTILLGEVKLELKSLLVKKGYRRVICANSMEEAVRQAFAIAFPGDTVLLSPGFASFDLFTDFQERGEKFKEVVKRL